MQLERNDLTRRDSDIEDNRAMFAKRLSFERTNLHTITTFLLVQIRIFDFETSETNVRVHSSGERLLVQINFYIRD